MAIFAARDFAGEPVATIHLPSRVPFGFPVNRVPDEVPAPAGGVPVVTAAMLPHVPRDAGRSGAVALPGTPWTSPLCDSGLDVFPASVLSSARVGVGHPVEGGEQTGKA